jgi:hypothetical protein
MTNTILKAQTKQLKNMFNMLTLSKTSEAIFNPIVIEIVEEKGKEPYIRMQATNSTNTVATIQKHRNIEIHQYEGSDPHIPINGSEILDALRLFDDEATIEIEFGQDNILIRDVENVKMKDEVKIPAPHLDTVESYDETPPFKVNAKGVIELKNKSTGKLLKFDIVSTIPTDLIRAQIKRADFAKITPRLFQLTFDGPELKLIVGNDSDAYAKSVTSTTDVDGKGSGMCTYGAGYEEIFGSLNGSVLFMASNQSPAWITQKEEDHIVQFLLAPAVVEG